MNLVRHILLLGIGAAFGVAMVLSCSNESPRKVDAATCDCPASEPPLAGRIIVRDDVATLGPLGGPQNGNGAAGTSCPSGGQLLSGSCTNTTTGLVDITLKESGFTDSSNLGWRCSFHNNTASPIQIKASVICLMPAQ